MLNQMWFAPRHDDPSYDTEGITQDLKGKRRAVNSLHGTAGTTSFFTQ